MPRLKDVPENGCPENRSYCSDYKKAVGLSSLFFPERCRYWKYCSPVN
jgi:hypothetical protein